MFFFHPRAGCSGVGGPGVCSGGLGGLWVLGENRGSVERLVWQDPNHRTPQAAVTSGSAPGTHQEKVVQSWQESVKWE